MTPRNQRGPAYGVCTWHLVGGGGLFSHQRGWAQISSHGPQGAAAKCSLGFRELLNQMEMPAGTLKADSREDL